MVRKPREDTCGKEGGIGVLTGWVVGIEKLARCDWQEPYNVSTADMSRFHPSYCIIVEICGCKPFSRKFMLLEVFLHLNKDIHSASSYNTCTVLDAKHQ